MVIDTFSPNLALKGTFGDFRKKYILLILHCDIILIFYKFGKSIWSPPKEKSTTIK